MTCKGIGGHQSPRSQSDEWATPPHVIAALGGAGVFDLDPCAMIRQPWACARFQFTRDQDGLAQHWAGHVYMNPPYGKLADQWLARLALHGDGIALVFARTETDMFFDHVWQRASAVLFLRGRLFFHREDGSRARHNGGAPSVLIAYGPAAAERLARCGLPGAYAQLSHCQIR